MEFGVDSEFSSILDSGVSDNSDVVSDNSDVASSSTNLKYDWNMDEEPLSVIDQAAQETERDPGSSRFLLGRVFGAPQTRIRPCKTCCPIPFATRNKQGETPKTFLGWTADDYENMTDTCPTHYVKSLIAERAVIRADMEANLKKMAKLKKQRAKKSKTSAVSKKRKVKAVEVEEEEDNDYGYVYDPHMETIIKSQTTNKQTKWNCPICKKSSKFGSAGCYGCGEWYHFKCVGLRHNNVPDKWECKYCQSN